MAPFRYSFSKRPPRNSYRKEPALYPCKCSLHDRGRPWTHIEHLEAIRHGLLLGQISKKRLSDIVKALAQQREKNIDPALIEIINDIELRAKVELAKLEMIG